MSMNMNHVSRNLHILDAKSDCDSASNIFCDDETNQTSDGEDKYDIESMTMTMKNFKCSFKKKPDLGLATKLKQSENEKNDALYELDFLKRKNINLENDMHNIF